MKVQLKKEIVSAQMKITNDVISAWKTQILFTLNKLKVFEVLQKQSKEVVELSSLLQIPKDSLRRLLNAAVAVGYIIKDGDWYSNVPYIEAVTNSETEGYLGNWLQMYEHWYQTFAMLPEAISEGRAVEDINANKEDYHHIFIKGMTDYASYRGRDIINHLDLSKINNLLDIGCGPGVYASIFCESYPNLYCTCYDVPKALSLAREYLGAKGMLSRIFFQPGNYKEDLSFGESRFEAVFISHVLHQEDETTCAEIVKKAYNALRSGGKIIIQAMFLNKYETGPPYASLHDLLSLLIFPGGKNYTYQQTMAILETAGFINIRYQEMSLFNVNSLVVGEKEG